MCCASTAKVNEIAWKAICKYDSIEIGIPVFMDNTAAIGMQTLWKKEEEMAEKWKQRKKYSMDWKRQNTSQ